MTTFKNINGFQIQYLASDPTNPIEGQVWFNSTSKALKGFGIQGANTANSLALTQFSIEVSTGIITFSIINSNAIGNPGASGISGTIKGDDGSSGTWSSSYVIGLSYSDGNSNPQQPESSGIVNLVGLTLTEDVTYTLS